MLIKAFHTLIWLVRATATIYILYAGLTGTSTVWLWLAVGMLVLESVVLVANGWECPLTALARRYTSDRLDNFDIYLSLAIARYNKAIFGSMLVVDLVLLLRNLVQGGL